VILDRAAAAALVPRPASTVVLLRDGAAGAEVLLTRRPASMAFGPGLHVFPGGAVEPADADPTAAARLGVDAGSCASVWAGDLEPGEALGHAMAAVRELYEEAGILLAEDGDGRVPAAAVVEAAHRAGEPLSILAARLGLRLRVDRLVPLSHWVTPPIDVTRRYDARFFVADAADGTGFRLDEREVTGHVWIRPVDALEAFRTGEIELWAPTSSTLRQVRAARRAADVRSVLAPLGPAREPTVERLGPTITRVRACTAGGLPGRPVCTYLVGRRRMVVVDPGDPNGSAAEAVLGAAAAAGGRVAAVAVTSPDPAHAGGVIGLAGRAGVPVLAGPGVGREVFAGVRALADGDRVDLGDVPLVAFSTPGFDPAHLAFDVEGEGCVLTGDLFDPGPATTVPEPIDEQAAARSRALVEALGSRRRLGAHDPASPAGRG
jgi:glyoxylase-like metal-dependent hydrolase (beta-lactamase superfamily II)/8-oxo-dGTP pyrophosphatase MutT (NUDIX family)